MMLAKQDIADVVERYLEVHADERSRLGPLLDQLAAEGADMTSRSVLPGHVTAGAVLVNADCKVLLVHHRVLDRWLMPGGHVEQADRSLAAAAKRELAEETAIDAQQLSATESLPLDIDVHEIPANRAKGEPAHHHFDFRYVFVADAPTVRVQADEVNDAQWRDLDDLPSPEVRDKLRRRLVSW